MKGGRWRCAVVRRKKGRKEKVELLQSLDGGHRVNTRGAMRGEDEEERQQQYTESIPLGRVWVLGGSMCRVAWPIVCKGSRSSSKEPQKKKKRAQRPTDHRMHLNWFIKAPRPPPHPPPPPAGPGSSRSLSSAPPPPPPPGTRFAPLRPATMSASPRRARGFPATQWSSPLVPAPPANPIICQPP